MAVLGSIELNLSGRNVGQTTVSNTYLCQVHEAIEYARDRVQSALDVHLKNCLTCIDAFHPQVGQTQVHPCNEYNYLADAHFTLLEYTTNEWESEHE